MKVKTEQKTGIFILYDAAWQTDRLSFSTESLLTGTHNIQVGAILKALKTHVNKY